MKSLQAILSILQLNDSDLMDATDIKVDLGKQVKIVYPDGFNLLDITVTSSLLKQIEALLPNFDKLNRTGFDECLHRISGIFNSKRQLIGLTIRLARELKGLHEPLIPWLSQSMLILGPPGYGKTSSLRNISKYLADESNLEVIIIDKSNEIAGYGDTTHPIVGLARRLPVKDQFKQVEAMMEAVENHSPHVVIVDEIRNEAEAYAAKTIGERGVSLIATAHAHTLKNLLKNPVGQILLGGVTDAAVSDKTAMNNNSSKIVIARKHPSVFSTVVELLDRNEIAVYTDVDGSVDAMLKGKEVLPTIIRKHDGKWLVLQTQKIQEDEPEFSDTSIGKRLKQKEKA